MQIGHKTTRLFFNDFLSGRPFLLTAFSIALADQFQIINVVEIDPQGSPDGRLEIAGNRQIQNGQWPLITLGLNLSKIFKGHNRLARGCGAHHKIGFQK